MPDLDHSRIERACAEIEALAEKATEGPWSRKHWRALLVKAIGTDAGRDAIAAKVAFFGALADDSPIDRDAAFIAASRTAVPALVGYCRGLMAELDAADTAAKQTEESLEADRAALVKVAREFFVCYPIHANRMAESLPAALLAEVKGGE